MNPFDTEYIFHAPHLGRAFAAALEKNVRLDDEEVTEPWAKALIKDAAQARASDIHLDPQMNEMRVRLQCPAAKPIAAQFP